MRLPISCRPIVALLPLRSPRLQACQSLVQRLRDPLDSQQLERSACLLVYALRLDAEHTIWQQTLLYPTLLQFLRAGPKQHGQQVITLVMEAVSIITRESFGGCSFLLDLGIVTSVSTSHA